MAINRYKDLPNKSLLRPDEVASFFGVSKRTVYGWVDIGKLEGVKPTQGILRIFRESVIKLIKSEE